MPDLRQAWGCGRKAVLLRSLSRRRPEPLALRFLRDPCAGGRGGRSGIGCSRAFILRDARSRVLLRVRVFHARTLLNPLGEEAPTGRRVARPDDRLRAVSNHEAAGQAASSFAYAALILAGRLSKLRCNATRRNSATTFQRSSPCSIAA